MYVFRRFVGQWLVKMISGDIWDYFPEHRIVIPTNIGYCADGRNPMGRGVAKQAAARFPGLPKRYGDYCQLARENTRVVEFAIGKPLPFSKSLPFSDAARLDWPHTVICFPTKPLNHDTPHLSWQGNATLSLIERSAKELAFGWREVQVALPLVGCGQGGLRKEDVLLILEEHLSADNFLLVFQRGWW